MARTRLQAFPTDGLPSNEVPGWAIESRLGDVIAFDPRARHAAFGGQGRRQVAVTYAARPGDRTARFELANLVLADQTVV